MKAQDKLSKIQANAHQVLQDQWRDAVAVDAAKERKNEEKKAWTTGEGDNKVSKWPFGNRWRRKRPARSVDQVRGTGMGGYGTWLETRPVSGDAKHMILILNVEEKTGGLGQKCM